MSRLREKYLRNITGSRRNTGNTSWTIHWSSWKMEWTRVYFYHW